MLSVDFGWWDWLNKLAENLIDNAQIEEVYSAPDRRCVQKPGRTSSRYAKGTGRAHPVLRAVYGLLHKG